MVLTAVWKCFNANANANDFWFVLFCVFIPEMVDSRCGTVFCTCTCVYSSVKSYSVINPWSVDLYRSPGHSVLVHKGIWSFSFLSDSNTRRIKSRNVLIRNDSSTIVRCSWSWPVPSDWSLKQLRCELCYKRRCLWVTDVLSVSVFHCAAVCKQWEV